MVGGSAESCAKSELKLKARKEVTSEGPCGSDVLASQQVPHLPTNLISAAHNRPNAITLVVICAEAGSAQ